MPLTLPFAANVIAMIDVRHGGATAAQAITDRLGMTGDDAPGGIAVYCGIDDDKVLTYAQWADAEPAERSLGTMLRQLEAAATGGRWSARLFRLVSSANRGPVDLAGDDATIAHTGLFAMHDESALAPFLALARDAAETAIARTPALLTANFHASLDGQRAVNLGFWENEQGFRDLAANPPFSNHYWDGLAENEAGFYRRTWVRS